MLEGDSFPLDLEKDVFVVETIKEGGELEVQNINIPDGCTYEG